MDILGCSLPVTSVPPVTGKLIGNLLLYRRAADGGKVQRDQTCSADECSVNLGLDKKLGHIFRCYAAAVLHTD